MNTSRCYPVVVPAQDWSSGLSTLACNRGGQAEKAAQLAGTQRGCEIQRDVIDDVLEQPPFALEDQLDAFLDRLLARVGVHIYGVALAESVAAVFRLALD